MNLLKFISICLILSVAACRPVDVDPPVPEGTVFPGNALGIGSAVTDSADGACASNCGPTITPGFRATVTKGSAAAFDLQSGDGNTTGISNSGYITIQAQMFDGVLYTFNIFIPDNSLTTYKVVGLRTWGSDPFGEAGFQYAEGVTGEARLSSAASGSLTVSKSNSRIIGTLNGSATLDNEETLITAEFNVAVQQQ